MSEDDRYAMACRAIVEHPGDGTWSCPCGANPSRPECAHEALTRTGQEGTLS